MAAVKESPKQEIARLRECRDKWRSESNRQRHDKKQKQLDAERYQAEADCYRRDFFTAVVVACMAIFVCCFLIATRLHGSNAQVSASPKSKSPIIFETKSQVSDSIPVASAPPYVFGSLLIINGSGRCSGTVIHIGPTIAHCISAAHCFQGNIGGKFEVGHPSGATSEATLLAMDRNADLALFSIPAKEAMGQAYVPESLFQGDQVAVGYTQGQGPKWKRVHLLGGNGSHAEWQVDQGPFTGGDSGGSIIITPRDRWWDGYLVGVISGSDQAPPAQGNVIYAASLAQIQGFLTKNCPN